MLAAKPALAVLAGFLLASLAAGRSLDAPDDPVPVGPPSPLTLVGPPAPGVPMRFGLDRQSIAAAQDAGLDPDYATVWIGHWTEHWGWQDADAMLQQVRDANVTPAVQFYYWGDDIHPRCFSDGCNGRTMAGWSTLATQLGQHLHATFGDGPALVILETEFNKDQVKDDEDLDAALAARALEVKQGMPTATVVLGLGDWYPQAWGTWDRAAAAADAIGLQAIAGSTHDSDEQARSLAAVTLAGVREATALFGKPVVITDVAVSSYPEPANLQVQADALQGFVDLLPDLHDAGVEAILYRSYVDVPTIPLDEHYGEAERHWGLAWGDGSLKPGGVAWTALMARGDADPVGDALAGASGPFTG